MKIRDIITLCVSPLGTNCYIVPVGNKKAVVIDPGGDYKTIAAELTANGLTTEAILLTHGHFDHTGAAASIRDGEDKEDIDKDYRKKVSEAEKKAKPIPEKPVTEPKADIPIYIREDDKVMLSDSVKAFAFFMPGNKFFPFTDSELALIKDLSDGQTLTFGDVTFSVMHTPGHSEGSVCFLCADEDGNRIIFSGDTLFKDSVGRSDGWSGSPQKLFDSLDKIRALDGERVIFPGHGENTTLETEKRFNPFLSDGLQ